MSTNFPTNIDTYTTIVDNVDNVVASHVNNKGDAITALETKVGITNSATVTSLDYFLKNASGSYRTHIHDGTSDDGAKVTLDNLANVTITGIADTQVLRYESSSGKWKNVILSATFAGLTDVTVSSPALREGIYYDTGDSKWHNGYANAVYAA